MKMVRMAMLAGLLAAGSTAQQASAYYFVTNYSGWRELGPSQKGAYAMGVWDLSAAWAERAEDQAASAGLVYCGIELNIANNMLVEAIDSYYSSDPEHWSHPPFVAFWQSIALGACKKHIDAQRAKIGLGPIN